MLTIKIFSLLPFTFFNFFGTPVQQVPVAVSPAPVPHIQQAQQYDFQYDKAVASAEPSTHTGIYLTSQTVSSPAGQQTIDEFATVGGNTIVFDVQNSGGKLAYPSQIPLSLEIGNRGDQIKDLKALAAQLHEKKFYVVARYVLFKNGFLASKKPAWILKKKGTQRPFFSSEGAVWLDPENPELREYIFSIARELAISGVDEVQFDYVRFPSGDKGGSIGYSFTNDATLSRDQAITHFIADMAGVLHGLNTKIGIDVFGIVVWDNISWKIIGQNIGELGKYVDAIYPMPYPSHFGRGWGGHANPADEPYFFVQETTKKFVEQTVGTGTEIRPWLQGFSMGVTRYGPSYVREQIRALADIGLDDFVVWNASNNYREITFKALK